MGTKKQEELFDEFVKSFRRFVNDYVSADFGEQPSTDNSNKDILESFRDAVNKSTKEEATETFVEPIIDKKNPVTLDWYTNFQASYPEMYSIIGYLFPVLPGDQVMQYKAEQIGNACDIRKQYCEIITYMKEHDITFKHSPMAIEFERMVNEYITLVEEAKMKISLIPSSNPGRFICKLLPLLNISNGMTDLGSCSLETALKVARFMKICPDGYFHLFSDIIHGEDKRTVMRCLEDLCNCSDRFLYGKFNPNDTEHLTQLFNVFHVHYEVENDDGIDYIVVDLYKTNHLALLDALNFVHRGNPLTVFAYELHRCQCNGPKLYFYFCEEPYSPCYDDPDIVSMLDKLYREMHPEDQKQIQTI